MEFILEKVADITYMSKLIPHHFGNYEQYIESGGGLNSHSNLCSLRSISCVLI